MNQPGIYASAEPEGMKPEKRTNLSHLLPLVLIAAFLFVFIQGEFSDLFSGFFEGRTAVVVQSGASLGTVIAWVCLVNTIISFIPGQKKQGERFKDPFYLFISIVLSLLLLSLLIFLVSFLLTL